MAKKARESYAFRDLKEMHCFDEMTKKVKAGIALEEIARWLQEDMFQQTGIKQESLARKLFRYKASLPPAELVKEPPVYVQKAIEKMSRGIKEIDELEKLYLLQLRRISIDAETESKINKLFSSTGHEIRVAADLLNSMMQKKMELGILSKRPEQLEVTGNLGVTGLISEDTDEATKAKLGLLAGKVLSVMSKAIDSTAKKDEDTEEEETAQDDFE
jgi:hypothetical protein